MSSNHGVYDPTEKVWHGPRAFPKYHPDTSIGIVLEMVMRLIPNKVAQIYQPTGETWTYRKMKQCTEIIAKNLIKKGITQDDVICVCASNTPYVAPLTFACAYVGSPLSTVAPSFDKNTMKHIFSITKPKIMFCDKKVLEKVKEAFQEIDPDCQIYILDELSGNGSIEDFLADVSEDISVPVLLKYGGDHTAVIICSSGTTGPPKGVTISHARMLSVKYFENDPETIGLCFSSVYWVSGYWCLYFGTLNGQTRIITNKPFSPELALDIIERFKVTCILTPPSQMVLLDRFSEPIQSRLSSLKTYLVGGSSVSFPVFKSMKSKLQHCSFLVGYGMTELASSIGYGEIDEANAVGPITAGLTVRIVDDEGNNLGPGQVGEVVVKMTHNWKGYFGNEEKTKEIYRDEWIFTGDLGYFNDFQILHLMGRKKDILKYKNFQIFPSEIEQVILEMPQVLEVVVCGVPDTVATDLPAAAVVKRPECHLKDDDVYNYVAEMMPGFNKLRGGVYFMDSLEKTASGKYTRRSIQNTLLKLYRPVINISEKIR